VAITSVGQGYKSTKERHDYKTGIETTYGGQELPMDIGKSKENFKDRKPKCFNCNLYKYIAIFCQKLKKEKDNRKCYKCEQVGSRVHYQRLQDRTENEESKCLEEHRNKHRRKEQEEGF